MRWYQWIITLALMLSATISHADAGKVVLISGSTRGIGLEMAKTFHQKGWIVWAGHRHKIPDEFKELRGINLVYLDVTDDESVKACIDQVIAKEGHIDTLINNAGYGLVGPVQDTTIEQTQALFDVNYFGVMRLVQATLPHMQAQKKGHIIMIGSTSGMRALPGLGTYACTKYALEAMTEALAIELTPWNIRVSSIQPGSVNNRWIDQAQKAPSSNVINEKLTNNLYKMIDTKAGTFGQDMGEIAQLVLDVAQDPSPDLRYPTSDAAWEISRAKFVDPSGNSVIETYQPMMEKLIQ